MESLTLIIAVSIIAFSFGFAYDGDRSPDFTMERFARDASKQKFGFAFAKRGHDELKRSESDFANTKEFAFAKRNSENDEERLQRFARELNHNKKFAFAFAKRLAGVDRDEQLLRFARPSFA
ncbi:hypothetical protein KIN20_020680 [Parelaphostrongylus tenuis]|uniref:Uncharacterized protein n=1 Tax=Parelaphostrongylus tenuis TaxID=148309 RepID=A0AAD5QTX3_PARTN|nr:hypothetical protein KIN20_020680 [Parelaphostrongylus tenuis]